MSFHEDENYRLRAQLARYKLTEEDRAALARVASVAQVAIEVLKGAGLGRQLEETRRGIVVLSRLLDTDDDNTR